MIVNYRICKTMKEKPVIYCTLPASLTDYNFEVITNFFPAYGTYAMFLKPTIYARHTAYMLAWHFNRVLERTLTNPTLTDVKSKKSILKISVKAFHSLATELCGTMGTFSN